MVSERWILLLLWKPSTLCSVLFTGEFVFNKNTAMSSHTSANTWQQRGLLLLMNMDIITTDKYVTSLRDQKCLACQSLFKITSCLTRGTQSKVFRSTTDIDFRPHYLHCICLKCLIWRRKFSNFVARYVKSEQYGEENNPYCSIAGVFPATARIQWLVHVLANTIKSNGKHFTVTRENLAKNWPLSHVIRACSWRWPDDVDGISARFSTGLTHLFYYITKLES